MGIILTCLIFWNKNQNDENYIFNRRVGKVHNKKFPKKIKNKVSTKSVCKHTQKNMHKKTNMCRKCV